MATPPHLVEAPSDELRPSSHQSPAGPSPGNSQLGWVPSHDVSLAGESRQGFSTSGRLGGVYVANTPHSRQKRAEALAALAAGEAGIGAADDSSSSSSPGGGSAGASGFKNLLLIGLRQSAVAIPAVLVLVAVIVVQFVIIGQVKQTSIKQGMEYIADDVTRAVLAFFTDKTAVVRNHAYLYGTGQPNADQMIVHPRWAELDFATRLPNPQPLIDFEAMTVPYFAKDRDLVALYNGMSNEQTWKIHREVATELTTQLRFAGTVGGAPYYERYERQRLDNESVLTFTLAKHQLKTYSPFQQGWYKLANASVDPATGKHVGVWTGPEFQGTGVGAGTATYGLEPVMVYNKRVDWQQPGRYSVFKLKVLTTRVNTMLRNLHLPDNSDVAICNAAGDLAAYRQPTSQVIPDAADPQNAKLAKFVKIWTVGQFGAVGPSVINSSTTGPLTHLDAPGVGIYSLDSVIPGWRVVIYVDGDVLIRPYQGLLDALLALGIVLIALSLASIIYSAVTVRQRIVTSSNETRARLLDDLLPEGIAGRVISKVDWPIADRCAEATVMFADMCDFTSRCSAMSARDVVLMLNTIVESWDHLSGHFGVEKIKTIGDAYMCASGITAASRQSGTHASDMILFALQALEELVQINKERPQETTEIRFRVGMASGEVSVGIIGSRRFAFDIFGDTVNLASRIEAKSEPNRIRVMETTFVAASLTDPTLQFSEPEDVPMKGKGHGNFARFVIPDGFLLNASVPN